MKRKINKVLIANRGEIAIRIIRACYDLGLRTVSIYSKEDSTNLFRTKADESYLVGEGKEPIRNYDLLSIIMLCLGGPDGSNYDGVLRMLDVLLSNETSEAEKRKILQDDYDIQMTQTMEREVSVMCNLSKGVEEKGVAKGILSSIKNLMETMGLTIEQAMAALKVPEGERQKYMDLLERQ